MIPSTSSTPVGRPVPSAQPEAGYETHRRLDEPVLPSAADDLLANDSVGILGNSSPADLGWPFSQPPLERDARAPSGAWQEASAAAWWADRQDKLERYVVEKPLKAALLAVGIGALAALAWGQRGKRTRRGRRS